MNRFTALYRTVLVCALTIGTASALALPVYTDGHADIGTRYRDFDPGPSVDMRLEMIVGLGNAIVDGSAAPAGTYLTADEFVIQVGPTAYQPIPRDSLLAPYYTGKTHGYFFGGTSIPGTPYLGFDNGHQPTMISAEWEQFDFGWFQAGHVHSQVTGIQYSGPASDPQVLFYSNYADTVYPIVDYRAGLSDDIPIFITPTLHSHLWMSMSDPGIYDITWKAWGTHATNGYEETTSVFRFEVLAVPEPASVSPLALGGLPLLRRRRLKDSNTAVASGPAQVSDKQSRTQLKLIQSCIAITLATIACGVATQPAIAGYTYAPVGDPAVVGGYGYALNNSGQVATTSLVTSHLFTDPTTYASPTQITIPGVTTATSTPGVIVTGINDAGEVAGRYRPVGLPANQTKGFIRHTDGSVDTVNYPGVASTSISEINNFGTIVGETRSDLTVFGVIRGFVATLSSGAYSFSEVHYPGATLTRAYGVNDSGDIVGQYQNSDALNRAFLLQNGSYTDLVPVMPPGGYVSLLATGISDNGMIVGTYRDAGNVSRAYIRLADGSWTYPDLVSPWAINNAGQVSGSFLNPLNGNTRTAYVASVPEPSSIVAALTLAGTAFGRRRRRLPAVSCPPPQAASSTAKVLPRGACGVIAFSAAILLGVHAQAQHAGDILIGKSSASQLTAVNLPTGTTTLPSVTSGSLFGWASNSMGFDNFVGSDPARDISQLVPGGYVSLEVVAIDPGLSFRSFSAFTSVFADAAGETLPIGISNSLHNHPIVFIDGAVVGPNFQSTLTAQVRFIDTGATALAASPTYTMSFRPFVAVPEPSTLGILGLGATCLVSSRSRRVIAAS